MSNSFWFPVSLEDFPGLNNSIFAPCRSMLANYKKRLSDLRLCRGSSLTSFSRFLAQGGLSRKELVTANAINKLMRRHVLGFVGDTANNWQEYGSYKNNNFDFYPSMFIEPLRRETESQLQLQEMCSHSQLFIEFVGHQQKIAEARVKMIKGEVGSFIAAWIYVHWRRHQRRENSLLRDATPIFHRL